MHWLSIAFFISLDPKDKHTLLFTLTLAILSLSFHDLQNDFS